jgi:hypothetical protein
MSRNRTINWGHIIGATFTELCPHVTGNPRNQNEINAFGSQSIAGHSVNFTIADLQARMTYSCIVESDGTLTQPVGASEQLGKLVQIIANALPSWAQPMSVPATAFVMGQCGSGLIVHLEQTSKCFVVFMELSTTTTKRWILMKTENPFLLVKYVITLQSIMCDNYNEVREFLDNNK